MENPKTALICGVSGQDGAYLARLLLSKGYCVFGSSRDADTSTFINLQHLKVRERVKTISLALNDFRSVLQNLSKISPDEIYNLSGQSSVALSFEQPVETFESITVGTLNLLEAIRFLGIKSRLYNAASSECFGNTNTVLANEATPFQPRSPYAVAKAAAFWQVANYREAYQLYACSGILFNHESSLRPKRFVTQKVISAVRNIANGSKDKLQLGNLAIQRDWGWAPEFVEAMWLMLQIDTPEDFLIGTGKTFTLENFVEASFSYVGLDWRDFVIYDKALERPTDIAISRCDASKAAQFLGWKPKVFMPELVIKMLNQEHS
jgi:GDPmannose 4,6-dehydratase